MGIEAVVARTLQVLLALGGAYLVALWFVLVVWTYRDIEARSRNVLTQVFSTVLVALFWVPGVLLYLILRPKDTLDSAYQRSLEEEYLLQDLEELPHCPSCERFIEDDFLLCPHCHTRLREPCLACGRLVDLRWSLCPYCGAAQGGEAAGKPEKVEAPAARWRAVARPRRGAPEPALVAASQTDGDAATKRIVAEEVVAERAATPESEPEPVTTGEEAPGAEEERAAGVERREPIPLLPAPRGRFRRTGGDRPTPLYRTPERPNDEQVPAGGLFTAILGSRNGEAGRQTANGARARRAARLAERAASAPPARNGNGSANGVVHDLDGFNGLIPATADDAADESPSTTEPAYLPTRAEGKGD